MKTVLGYNLTLTFSRKYNVMPDKVIFMNLTKKQIKYICIPCVKASKFQK